MSISFYSPREAPYGAFSNFSPHGINLDGAWWPTTEHYFQAQKFVGTPYADKIRAAFTPKLAAELGRSRKMPLRPDWEKIKDAVMLKAVQRKFETHAELCAILLATGEEEIVENAPGDYYWGCGADGSGKNMLGITLMQVRAILRQESYKIL
jgi:N-glycosidase YbiA